MKSLPAIYLLGISFLTSLLLSSAAPAQTAIEQLLADAQAAYRDGDLETAKRNFETVYSLDPRNETAINFLRAIRNQGGGALGGNTIQKQLENIVLPQVEFRDATLHSVFDYLSKAVAKESKGKVTLNFVLQLPDDQAKKQTVSLSLKGVPFTEVLRYLSNLGNVKFQYQRFAVLVTPMTSPTATAQPATPEQPGKVIEWKN